MTDDLGALLRAVHPDAEQATRPDRAPAPRPLRRLASAWFGRTPTAGVCRCCQKAAPVYTGYNGGASTGEAVCGPCQRSDHMHTADAAADLARLRAELGRLAGLAAEAIPQYRAVGTQAAIECAEVHRVFAEALGKLAGAR